MSLLAPSLRAARALKRAERALRDWQDDPDSPRADVDKMLVIIQDLREWVLAHLEADVERAQRAIRDQARKPENEQNP